MDYIIQYDPPDTIESYVHRAGRACRGILQKKGVGLLILSESEVGFVELLKKIDGMTISEFEFPTKKLMNV